MAQKNNDHLFDIAPDQQPAVGTQILDKNMPSNIDFEKHQNLDIQMTEMKSFKNVLKVQQVIKPIDFQILNLKSYMVKGKPLINIQPQFSLDSIIPQALKTFNVKCFDEEYSSGFKKIWQSIVGYIYRQLYIYKGYIYLFQPQKSGLKVIKIYSIKNIFKVFIDLQDSKIRFVIKQENSENLISRDYESKQIKEIVQKLSEQMDSMGLKLI